MDIIDRINLHIESNGIRTKWVAHKIGISPCHLNDVLKRRHPLTDNVLNRLNQLWQARDDIKFYRDDKK